MYTAIIIFMFFAVLINCIAIVSIILCKQSQQKIVPDYTAAQHYIDTLDKRYNWDYLIEYLAVHFAKSPNGILPKQSMTLECRSHGVNYKMTFYDCQNIKTIKYLKQAMALLREKRKPLKVIREANKIIKRTKRMATVS